jgi:ribosome biogenesis protein BRX1
VLIEIGPRLCLNPIKAFDGSMGGETLWQNPKFITPTRSRSKKFSSF